MRESNEEIHVGYGVTLGARAIGGLPKLGLEPFATVWLRWNGRVFWVWDDAVGTA